LESKDGRNAQKDLYYRRVQLVGKSTYIVSLPKEWARVMGIKPGSLITMRIDPAGFLIIEAPPKKKSVRRVAKVELSSDDIGKVIRECISAYIAGYDEIEIVFDEKYRDVAVRVRKILEEIALGLSLLEETPNSLRFYTVVDPRSMRFMDVLSRACRVANSMLTDIRGACERGEQRTLEGIIERDQLVDKLYILALKQLTGALLGEFRLSELELKTIAETLHIFIAVKSVERIADHATIIASELLRIGMKACNEGKWFLDMLKSLESLLSNACKALLKVSKEEAHRIAREAALMRVKAREARESEALRGNVAILRIADSLDRIAGYLMDIAEATIDIETIRSVTEAGK